MQFNYSEESKITEVTAEGDDACVFCRWFEQCPLVGALEINLVYPSADRLTIEDCGLYEFDGLTDLN